MLLKMLCRYHYGPCRCAEEDLWEDWMFRWWRKGLRCRVLQILMAGLIAPSAAQGQAAPGGLYLIDAHSQIDNRTDPSVVIQLMNEGGVHRLILSTTGHASQEVVLSLARQFPDRIVPAVRAADVSLAKVQQRHVACNARRRPNDQSLTRCPWLESE